MVELLSRISILVVLLGAMPSRLESGEAPQRTDVQEETSPGVSHDLFESSLTAIAKSWFHTSPSGTPAYYADRAAREIRKGNYDLGIAELSKAIEDNPQDAGKAYDPSSGRQLSADSLQNGNEQVRRMLNDRPVMLNHVGDDDLLVQWAIRKFAGEDLGALIEWDPAPPEGKSRAEHISPIGGQKAAIRVAKTHLSGPNTGVDLTFEELWAAVVFELHNITNAPTFEQLWRDAADGKLTRDAFVAAMFRSEYEAMQRTRAFYCRIYLFWAKEKGLRSDPGIWHTQVWSGPDDSFREIPRNADYPWGVYGTMFDKLSAGVK